VWALPPAMNRPFVFDKGPGLTLQSKVAVLLREQ
jgi:hypothetical protein